MSVLAYCLVCGRLVNVQAMGFKWGSREQRWYPIAHTDLAGKNCDGERKGI